MAPQFEDLDTNQTKQKRKQNIDYADENVKSLKERFGETKGKEILIERKSVSKLIRIWNFLLSATAVTLALIGVAALVVPELRSCIIELLMLFIAEVSI